jgi:3-methyladenine DNA glycosylase AlkD/uncharacterized protein YdhG (YjbR/CyaY superfamily)
MPRVKAKPKTMDEYLADVPAIHRAELEKLRRTIHAAAPGAEEGISYGLAAFRLNGRPLVAFGGWVEHCALYPMSSETVKLFREELASFETSKGTIRFTNEKSLPAGLVKKLVKARIEENFSKTQTKAVAAKKSAGPMTGVPKAEVKSVLATLKELSDAGFREDMSSRYGIVTRDAFGVRMNEMQRVAKEFGCNHALALALWQTGNYEARTVAAYVADPGQIKPALMDRWCRDFDNWAICDTVCFKLFDRVPHAWAKVEQWANRRGEFERRAAFALLACLALHDKRADNSAFIKCLPLIETAAIDERNFVKKGVSWALRAIGGRNAQLRDVAARLAKELASLQEATPRWIGKDVLRALTKRAD